ncbi:putative aldouronate transport system permease protein [Kitasatospora sp. SolWspMP-SS2h]|uniref:ABC transporter permease n=1 Tax=Kitasatospora sp. SolWspMP-SS2h TaxID=1305729 RepID=UPI000DB9F066|nr:ABC transporter permease subunit [Kitasatospora sp. SolWspMP-SS2h]RAJ36812.1 putative aldouronate transport system permease protein [Kitasatospora sp. SolWspMP-SS2h]
MSVEPVARERPSARSATKARPAGSLRTRMWRARWMYLMMLPGLLFFVVFCYVPLLGNVAAFQDYSPFLGFSGSQWVGFHNFAVMLDDPQLVTAAKNTVVLSFLQIVFAFPAPIALAVLLNSVMSERVKRWVQAVVYLPHFVSWVIVIAIWQQLLGGDGLVTNLISDHGTQSVAIMSDPHWFKSLITAQVIWKDTGWNTIIFLAAITRIDSQLYESAAVDGAGPWRRIWHVTLPGMRGVLVLMLILRLGNVLTVGFEQILLQQHTVGMETAQVLDTFVYTRGVVGGDWGLAAAAGLLKGVICTALVVAANKLVKRTGSEGAF